MKKGFTLIEMLVVIGIIGILTGVLIAALSGGTDAANASKCLANMHSLALAVHSTAMNMNDDPNKRYYPFAGSFTKFAQSWGSDDTVQSRGWIGWKSKDPESSYVSTYSSVYDDRHYCLTNGTVWTAMNGNATAYMCPEHAKVAARKFGGKLPGGPCWSYAMSEAFHWHSRHDGRPFSANRRGLSYSGLGHTDRMLMFAEIPFQDIPGVQTPAFSASADTDNDPILQYDKGEGTSEGEGECIGFNHRSAKQWAAHVCYVDGHTEKILLPKNADLGNIRTMTGWLCNPRDENGKYFDIVVEGGRFKKLDN